MGSLKISSVDSEEWGTTSPILGYCAGAVRTSPSGFEAGMRDWVKIFFGHQLKVSYLNILSAIHLEKESDKMISGDSGGGAGPMTTSVCALANAPLFFQATFCLPLKACKLQPLSPLR